MYARTDFKHRENICFDPQMPCYLLSLVRENVFDYYRVLYNVNRP